MFSSCVLSMMSTHERFKGNYSHGAVGPMWGHAQQISTWKNLIMLECLDITNISKIEPQIVEIETVIG